MKLIGNIEVSGIKRVVFYDTGESWIRADPIPGEDDEIVWFRENVFDTRYATSHDEMMRVVQDRIWNPVDWRIWIHGETMNIVPDEKYKKKLID